jgi:hypothetical protein
MLGLVSLGLWAFVAFLIVLGVEGIRQDGWLGLLAYALAALAACPAWLTVREAVRIRRARVPLDRGVRGFALLYPAFATGSFFVMGMTVTGSVGVGVIAAFAGLTAAALGAADLIR